jgi:uncharacterized protein (DUF427 family)
MSSIAMGHKGQSKLELDWQDKRSQSSIDFHKQAEVRLSQSRLSIRKKKRAVFSDIEIDEAQGNHLQEKRDHRSRHLQQVDHASICQYKGTKQ